MSETKIRNLLIELYKACRQKETYSVEKAAQQMGLDYELVKTWASTSEDWNDMFQNCRVACAINVDYAGMNEIIPFEEFIKYALECDDNVIALYPTPEAQEELLHYIRTTDEDDYDFGSLKFRLQVRYGAHGFV